MKKTYKLRILSLAVALILSISSCSDYLDINTSPNNLQTVFTQNLLPGAEIGVAFNLSNTIQIVSSLWMQHMAGTGTQTQPFDIYNVNPNDFQNDWNSLYATVLDDLNQIIIQGKVEGNNVHVGMAKILTAYSYAVVTDMWGDVPYSQALNINEYLKPEYDTQQGIYQGLQTLLDDAKADLRKTNVLATSAGDLIYSGDIGKWERLANSIKLKLFLQFSVRDAATAKAGIDALILENKFIDANANNFQITFLPTSGAQNPIYQYTHLTRQNDMITSKRFYDSMTQNNDPRIPYYFTSIAGGTYPTYDNGQQQATVYPGAGTPANVANRSRWGRYIVGPGTQASSGTLSGPAAGTAPVRMITKSMINFWLAEAALTLGTAGDPSALFEQAMRDQFADISTFLSAPATFGDTYIAARKAEFDSKASALGRGGKLNVMIREKWVSSAGIAYEAYNDYRRTGFPVLNITLNNQPGVTRIPYRLPYIQSEIQSNIAHVPLQDYPAGLLVKVWWQGN